MSLKLCAEILINSSRQQGTTTLLIGAMYANPKALLIVDNLQNEHLIKKQHPTLRDRILTLEDIGRIKGYRGPLLFDTTAISALLNEKEEPTKMKTVMSFTDGYCKPINEYVLQTVTDGYGAKNEVQLNVKMTKEDENHMKDINQSFFENEASSSMLGRILLRKGIEFFKKLK